MRQILALGAAALILVFGLITPAQATPIAEEPSQEHEGITTEEHGETTTEEEAHGEAEAHEDDEPHSGGHEGYHHKNDVAVFLGATDEEGHDTEFTWGLDYNRLISDGVAVGVYFDHVGGDLRNSIVGASVIWLPWKRGFELIFAPGIEFHDGRDQDGSQGDEGHEGEGEEGHGGADKNEKYFVLRLGVGWSFEIGESYGIIPTVYLDLVDGEKVWVYGVRVAYAW